MSFFVTFFTQKTHNFYTIFSIFDTKTVNFVHKVACLRSKIIKLCQKVISMSLFRQKIRFWCAKMGSCGGLLGYPTKLKWCIENLDPLCMLHACFRHAFRKGSVSDFAVQNMRCGVLVHLLILCEQAYTPFVARPLRQGG
jgi:hypothetical protein